MVELARDFTKHVNKFKTENTYAGHFALCPDLGPVKGQNPWNKRQYSALYV